MIDQDKLDEITRRLSAELTDEGRLIQAGWVAFQAMVIPKDAPQIQLDEMRNAFFAGASHLFSSIMSILDPGEEPTERDLKRMDNINKELDRYIEEFKRKHRIK